MQLIMLLIMNMMPDSSCRPSKSDQKIRITITSRYIFGYIIDLVFFMCDISKFYYFQILLFQGYSIFGFPIFGEIDDPNIGRVPIFF